MTCRHCKGEGEVLIPQPRTASAPYDWGPCDVCKGTGHVSDRRRAA